MSATEFCNVCVISMGLSLPLQLTCMISYQNVRQHPSQGVRRRTVSQVSIPSAHSSKISIDIPKTRPMSGLSVQIGPSDVFGAFSPTRSAMAALRLLVAADPFGVCDFSPHVWPTGYNHRSRKFASSGEPSIPSAIESPNLSTPYISTTSAADDVSVVSSPASPSTALLTRGEREPVCAEMNPILASLERMSMLCERSICSTCSKPGRDYPRCGKCGANWCSRECRLAGGKRHMCSNKRY
jgi:hypothetical protein